MKKSFPPSYYFLILFLGSLVMLFLCANHSTPISHAKSGPSLYKSTADLNYVDQGYVNKFQ